MISGLRLNKGQQPLVVLCGAQEFEGDAARADGAHHCGDLQRRLMRAGRDLEVKNIIHAHVRFALDDAATHREIEHGTLAADLSPGEREIQSYRNPKVLAPVYRMPRPIQSNA